MVSLTCHLNSLDSQSLKGIPGQHVLEGVSGHGYGRSVHPNEPLPQDLLPSLSPHLPPSSLSPSRRHPVVFGHHSSSFQALGSGTYNCSPQVLRPLARLSHTTTSRGPESFELGLGFLSSAAYTRPVLGLYSHGHHINQFRQVPSLK